MRFRTMRYSSHYSIFNMERAANASPMKDLNQARTGVIIFRFVSNFRLFLRTGSPLMAACRFAHYRAPGFFRRFVLRRRWSAVRYLKTIGTLRSSMPGPSGSLMNRLICAMRQIRHSASSASHLRLDLARNI